MERKDMDYPTRMQKDYKEHLEQSKLSKRTQEIQRALMQKRKHDKNPIAVYDLSSFKPRYGKKNKDFGIVEERTTKANPVTP